MNTDMKKISIKSAFVATLVLMGNQIVLAGEVTGLNSFNAGEAATASAVNENFSAVESAVNDNDSRITAIEDTSSSNPNFEGYGVQFSADGVLKNVVVLESDVGDGIQYNVRSRYANSSEEISINGVLTVRPFIANYASARTDDEGNISNVNNYIEAPDTSSYISSLIEQSTYSLPDLVKNVTKDTNRETSQCAGSSAQICLFNVEESATGNFISTYGFSKIRAITGPFTVNGLTFDDVRFASFTGDSENTRVRAKGIGEVLRVTGNDQTRRIIYYRVNDTEAGSLVGTPFEPGVGELDGLFF